MATKKTTKKAKKTRAPKPSATSMAAAEAMLSVPVMLATASEQLGLMAKQLDRMEQQIRSLLLPVPEPTAPNRLLIEPAPAPPALDPTLLQEEFKHEPKGSIP